MSAASKLGPLLIAACCGAGLTLLIIQAFGSNAECDHAAAGYAAVNQAAFDGSTQTKPSRAELGGQDRLALAEPSATEQPQTIELTPSAPAEPARSFSHARSRRSAHRRVRRSRTGGLALSDPSANDYWDLKEVPDPFAIGHESSRAPIHIRPPRRGSSRKAAIRDPWAD